MKTINTILSRTDQSLLENALLTFGRIVTFGDLSSLMANTTGANTKQRIARLVEKGWLVRIKNGLYLIVSDVSTLGNIDISEYVIASALQATSYVSFENALQYHAMYDQALATVRSVTTEATRSYRVQNLEYIYSLTKDNLYFGFTDEVVEKSYRVRIAEAEKALLDMLYFKHSGSTVTVVLEKIRDNGQRLDMDKLQRYAARYGIGMMRTVGFLLDQVLVDTTNLLAQTNAKKGTYSKLTSGSKTFNAKWRLYYDDHLIA